MHHLTRVMQKHCYLNFSTLTLCTLLHIGSLKKNNITKVTKYISVQTYTTNLWRCRATIQHWKVSKMYQCISMFSSKSMVIILGSSISNVSICYYQHETDIFTNMDSQMNTFVFEVPTVLWEGRLLRPLFTSKIYINKQLHSCQISRCNDLHITQNQWHFVKCLLNIGMSDYIPQKIICVITYSCFSYLPCTFFYILWYVVKL